MTYTYDTIAEPHKDYLRFEAKWTQLTHCLEGEEEIKEQAEKYLPYPVRVDDVDRKSEDFLAQYELYIQGAHFVEYTAEAVEDLISAAFRRPIEIDPPLPNSLDYLDIEDLAKETVGGVGSYGRVFLLVDYPSLEMTPSMKDDDTNKAYLNIYEPLDVINWTATKRSGKSELIRVVLRELDEIALADDNEEKYLYRELVMIERVFQMHIYREGEPVVTVTPSASGQVFGEIPGMFVGTTSNTAKIDKSPVIGISNSNLKHYQTWADLMHVQVYVGNPQIVLAGLAAGWNKQAEKNNVKVKMDAAHLLALEGDNSSASLLEIDTNSLVHYRTLEILEQSMAEQGARIKSISKKAGVESAEALKIRSSASMSKLAAIVVNTEDALTQCLKWSAQYMGDKEPTTKISINKEFYSPEPDGSLLGAISEAEAVGTAPRGTAITYLKQIELVDDSIPNEVYLKDMELNKAQLTNDVTPEGKSVKGETETETE